MFFWTLVNIAMDRTERYEVKQTVSGNMRGKFCASKMTRGSENDIIQKDYANLNLTNNNDNVQICKLTLHNIARIL